MACIKSRRTSFKNLTIGSNVAWNPGLHLVYRLAFDLMGKGTFNVLLSALEFFPNLS